MVCGPYPERVAPSPSTSQPRHDLGVRQVGEQAARDEELGASYAASEDDHRLVEQGVVTRIRQPAGRPTGVMPPYSMPVSSTARSIGRNEHLRTSSSLRTNVLTSARVSARTTQAAIRSSPAREPDTTTQLPLAVIGMS